MEEPRSACISLPPFTCQILYIHSHLLVPSFSVSDYGTVLGQSRIFVTMARAGLIPKSVANLNSRGVPWVAVLLAGGIAGILGFLVNLDSMWNFVSIGTLFAYGAVCLACLWRRYNQGPDPAPLAHKRIMAGQVRCAYGTRGHMLSTIAV